MADFVICPRCRRQNPADAVFCNRCGVRLLNAGVYYRNRDTSSSVGMGQLLLGLGVLVLAGLVLGGGAILLLGSTPRPTPTHVAGGPTGSIGPTSSTASPSPSPAPTPTLLVTPSPSFPFSFPPTLPPTPTPSPGPTLPPSPTPVPTPSPTPVDCAVASTGTDVKELVLSAANPSRTLGKVWCIRDVTFHPIFDPGVTTGYGTARLMRGTKVVAQYTCTTASCGDGPFMYVPPKRISAGSTLSYQFTCQDSADTVEDDCADAIADGMTITISYEAIAGP